MFSIALTWQATLVTLRVSMSVGSGVSDFTDSASSGDTARCLGCVDCSIDAKAVSG